MQNAKCRMQSHSHSLNLLLWFVAGITMLVCVEVCVDVRTGRILAPIQSLTVDMGSSVEIEASDR